MKQKVEKAVRVRIIDPCNPWPPYEEGSCPSEIRVEAKGHSLTILNWWENCGETGTSYECSCGFRAEERRGDGCWQQGHNQPLKPEIDDLHRSLKIKGMEAFRRMAEEEEELVITPKMWEEWQADSAS